jgi:hypothetical protein
VALYNAAGLTSPALLGRGTREMLLRRKLSVLLAAALLSAMMLTMTAAPAFAFIHEFIPAGKCADSASHGQAGDNETAARKVPRLPVEQPPAPDDCPAPQK